MYVCSATDSSLAGASRYAVAARRVTSPLQNPRLFCEDVRALVDHWRIDVLLPMTEQSVNAQSLYSSMFGDICVAAAAPEQFRAISDKQLVLQAAPPCGIGVPRQFVVSDRNEREAMEAAQGIAFPVVVKPSRSVAQTGNGQVKLRVTHCRDVAALRRALAESPTTAYPLLVQERIVGPGMGIFLLIWDGELVASFAHRRLRERPPSGGVSVYRESIALDPGLVERSRRLLGCFDWKGVAMIEYKIDEATGTPFLMEINGRFWGSLQLAIDAGVDFPSLLVARLCGVRVFGPARYQVGIRSRWEWGSVDYLLARLRHSDTELSLPPGSPGRLRSILGGLIPWRPGDRPEVFRLTDPAPFIRETFQYFRRK